MRFALGAPRQLSGPTIRNGEKRQQFYHGRAVTFRRWYAVLLSIACLWAIFNCAYVYLGLEGARTYRIESSVLIFVALLVPAALSRGTVERSVESASAPLWALAIAAVIMWLAIMVPRLTYPFLSDDYVFLGRYQHWADLWRVQALFRPLFAVIFWIAASLGRGSTVPFHLLALALHFGCAMLVGMLVRRILGNRTAGVLGFAVFLVSPLQLEATLWVSGLQELLCACFALSAAVVYSSGPDATLRRALVSTPFILLALLSKETGVGYLVCLPMLDVTLERIKRPADAVRGYLVFVSLGVVYLIVRSRFTMPDPDFLAQPTRYLLKQFLTMPYKFFVQPWNGEAVAVPFIVSVVLCTAVLLLLLASSLRKRLSRVTLAGPLVVISFSLPLYAYFFVAPDLMAARYLYLPFVGWTLLMIDLLTSTFRRPATTVLIVGAIVTCSAVALQLNLRPWRTTADVIAAMESAVESGRDPLEAARAWERERSIQLTRRGHVPIEYQGVYVLLNGYDEFVRFTSARTPAGQ